MKASRLEPYVYAALGAPGAELRILRWGRKVVDWEHRVGDGQWVTGKGPYVPHLYGVEQLAATPDALVVLCQREADVVAARKAGVCAIASVRSPSSGRRCVSPLSTGSSSGSAADTSWTV